MKQYITTIILIISVLALIGLFIYSTCKVVTQMTDRIQIQIEEII